MVRFSYILYFLLSFNLGCSFQVNEVKQIEVEFDGGKDEFYKKYNLWQVIEDEKLIKAIMVSIDTSELLFFNCPPHRPVMWEIDAYAKGENGKSKHLFKVVSNTYNKLSLWKGESCYKNDSLINLMIDLMRVDEIRKFEGQLLQSDYNLILQNK